MANPFHDAVQDLERAEKSIEHAQQELDTAKEFVQKTIVGLNNAMQAYENEFGQGGGQSPPSSQLPA